MDFDGSAIRQNRQGAFTGEAYVIRQLYHAFRARGHEVLLFESTGLTRKTLEQRDVDFLLGVTCWRPLPVSDRFVTGYFHVNYWLRGLTPAARYGYRALPISLLARLLMTTRADLFFTNSPSMRDALQERGKPAYMLPLFADVDFYRPMPPDPRYACDACYLGANFLHKGASQVRDYLVAAAEVCNFRIYGCGWGRHPILRRYWGGILPPDDVPALYSSAKIVINFNATLQGRTGMCNNRLFEAIACGAHVVNDPIPWAQQTFGDLVSFSPGGDHLRQLVPSLLADRARLAENAIRAREIIAQRFTPGHAVDRILEGYGLISHLSAHSSRPTSPQRT